jgi:methionyl-tRNA formyltransferase
MGSPDFAVPALRALHGAGHEIFAVYCQPPRPAGRGNALRLCPVHAAAEQLGLPIRTPATLRGKDEQTYFEMLDLDAAIVAAYGLILPPNMLKAPWRGCINVHPSLLPRWRGASPIQAAILAGDDQTGVTIMQMEPGLDTGPILLEEAIPITPTMTGTELHDILSEMGARLILRALAEDPPPRPQPEEGATYAPKLKREDGRMDWTREATFLERQVRALDPWPGTYTLLGGDPLKVLSAMLAEGEGPPGTVLDEKFTIACGRGAIRLLKVQRASRPPRDGEAFLRGRPGTTGTTLG